MAMKLLIHNGEHVFTGALSCSRNSLPCAILFGKLLTGGTPTILCLTEPEPLLGIV